jgi:hypothetical protein
VFLEVMTREYEDAVLFGQVHQLSVDAYAVQHAGGMHPDKSVAVHLTGLHWACAHAVAPAEIPRRLQALAAVVTSWPHFEPPATRAHWTIAHPAAAETPAQHAERVREWSRAVWDSWSAHHTTIAALAARVFERHGSEPRDAH